ncbi:uncharacterized protein LOC119683434 isoform X2 [Teleopsis dalmanni]|uniref:uncharacterized protein LOC119683434 isoform X2 n=1 Tax=Teleopsis dalmanni TaxID=139649 RepID=UPI0018CFA540|nr:uncharacterized protein LOC119683434 isoform X2 [Teleopsis dalmanni]
MVNKQYSASDLETFMKIAANWQSTNQNLLEGVDIKGEMQQYLNNPAMNMYKKRERTQNWNHLEKKFLLELCRKDMRIIENKRLDAGLTAVKNKAWKIIHQKFSNQFGTDRTCNRLKEQWRRMKACTRNEILDYNTRLSRFGPEMADRKKPSPFTFEVWDFMQEAKKACKSEALDGIDYSKMPLALEEDFEYKEDEHNAEEEHDMDDSRTPPQELCDIDIKEETNETFNDTYNESLVNGDRLTSSPNHSRNALLDTERINTHSPTTTAEHNTSYLQHNGDMPNFTPTFNMNNISATLEALNALRTGQFSTAAAAAAAAAMQNNIAAVVQQQKQLTTQSDDDQPVAKRQRTSSVNGSIADEREQQNISSVNGATSTSESGNNNELLEFMEMQKKEHMMRMKILEMQYQAAKYSSDIAEINKTLAIQKLQEFASKRMPN